MLSFCENAVSRLRRRLISEDNSNTNLDNDERSLIGFEIVLLLCILISSGLETTDV